MYACCFFFQPVCLAISNLWIPWREHWGITTSLTSNGDAEDWQEFLLLSFMLAWVLVLLPLFLTYCTSSSVFVHCQIVYFGILLIMLKGMQLQMPNRLWLQSLGLPGHTELSDSLRFREGNIERLRCKRLHIAVGIVIADALSFGSLTHRRAKPSFLH